MAKQLRTPSDYGLPEVADLCMPDWPKESVYRLVPDMAVVDAAIEEGRRTGNVRAMVTQLLEIVRPVADNRDIVELVNPLDGKSIYTTSAGLADLVSLTRRGELRCKADLARARARGNDLVQLYGGCNGGWCRGYVGIVFSVSGASSEHPPLSVLPRNGVPMHVGCLAWIEPFHPRSEPDTRLRDVLVDETALIDPRATEAVRISAATRRATRVVG